MKHQLLLFSLACALTSVLHAEPAGKIAPKPLFRDPVYDGAADPVVVWNAQAQHRWMFYSNRRANQKQPNSTSTAAIDPIHRRHSSSLVSKTASSRRTQ